MKKVLLAAAMLLSLQMASAQIKSVADMRKAVESAKKASEDPKKAEKIATWLKLGETYYKSYDNAFGGVSAGYSDTEISFILGSTKPVSQEMVVLGGEQYRKDSYPTMDMYFGMDGRVAMLVPTDLPYEDALDRSVEAYAKAYAVDPKHSKDKDIAAALRKINDAYNNAGTAAFYLGDLKKASEQFEKAAKTLAQAPVSEVDTNAFTNAGLAAYQAADYARAKELYLACLEHQILGEGGDIYAKLADVSERLGNIEEQKAYLQEGVARFPDSQAILIGLINYNMKNNEDPDAVFGYLHEAQKNDPANASLWYVEGNILGELGRSEEAAERFHEAQKIDPEFIYGYIGEGLLYLKQADQISEQADNEFNQRKYDALIAQYNQKLKDTAVIFEKVVLKAEDPSIKFGISQYLKEIYFRLRGEAEYNALYEKYKAIVENGE